MIFYCSLLCSQDRPFWWYFDFLTTKTESFLPQRLLPLASWPGITSASDIRVYSRRGKATSIVSFNPTVFPPNTTLHYRGLGEVLRIYLTLFIHLNIFGATYIHPSIFGAIYFHPNIFGAIYIDPNISVDASAPRRSHNICLRIHQLQRKEMRDEKKLSIL